MEEKYSVKAKVNGKFFSFGNVKKNQYGNFSLGMKMTPELRAMVQAAADGSWINWSLFEDSGERKPKPVGDDQTIPF